MKKSRLLALLLSAIMCLGLTACSNTPTKAVEKDLKAFQKSESSVGELNLDDKELTEQILEDYATLLEMEKDFEYEVISEEIAEDGETAVVKVQITTYDFGLAYLDTWDEIIESGNTDAVTLYSTMFKKMIALEYKNYTEEIEINCTLKDGKWKTDLDENDAFKNAIFGGVPDLVKEFAQL